MDWAAWTASKLGLVDTIPYHPIGGIKRVRGGFVTPDTPAPLGSLTNMRTDYEAHFLMQNLMLTGEALRLGGWVHGAPMIPYVWRRDPAKGELGLGFREYSAKTFDSRWKRWPPVPASQPNYVGIDGVLEGLCPPYITDMDAAVLLPDDELPVRGRHRCHPLDTGAAAAPHPRDVQRVRRSVLALQRHPASSSGVRPRQRRSTSIGATRVMTNP